MGTATDRVRVAALADLHCTKTSAASFQSVFAQVTQSADVFLPVLGNHDYESGKQEEVRQILVDAGVRVLDGDACEEQGIGFAGIKGFVGGFGPRMLTPWGEETLKRLVHEAITEALKLESALARLRTPHRIALLHYAPIQATVEGEPLEIYPFLGCSRLEEPLNRYPVNVVIHGHAHHGRPEGRTQGNVPVYNVGHALLRRAFPERPPFRLVEFPVVPAPAEPAGSS